MPSEADVCRKYVLPKLHSSGWNDDQINEQRTFTDGRIMVAGTKVYRHPHKRADYLLRYKPDLVIAVVEAKAIYKNPRDGLQQTKEYAQMLELKFDYATNGQHIIEHDFLSGLETDLDTFPTPEELWKRLNQHLGIQINVFVIL